MACGALGRGENLTDPLALELLVSDTCVLLLVKEGGWGPNPGSVVSCTFLGHITASS